MNKKLLKKIINNPNNNQGLSLILTLLIISSILTGTLLVGDVIIRHSQVVKGTEISEMAYFASESAIEKAAFDVMENYVDISAYSLSDSLTNESEYEIDVGEVVIDDSNPSSGDVISAGHPWEITLAPNESFSLDMDINGAIYPTSIDIDKSGSVASDLLIYECTSLGTPRICSAVSSQTFQVSFPYTLTVDSANKYYKIRINNIGAGSEIYSIEPANNSLPIGVVINATGIYTGYERIISANFPKWQQFGI
ncbi:hypothetical protein ISS06_02260 [Patescibacteria group bacterium]|nr:hypothetical protein [Patescibacteria group bacterium]